MTEAFNIADLRLLARKRLPRGLFEYVDRGSEDERSLGNNRDALARIRLQPRVLVDVRKRKLERVIFDKPAAMPIAISPTAVGGMLWYDGDVLAARAAAAAGIPYTLSTASVTPIERVAEHGGGRLWFQLYVFTLREHMRSLIDRARAVNCEALVVTVDTSMVAKREYNQRNGFGVPIKYTPRTIVDVGLHPRWLLGVMARYVMTTGAPRMVHYPGGQSMLRNLEKNPTRIDSSLNWKDIDEIRKLWPGRLLIKGIMHPDDAALAVAHGADGVVISNHGGRNQDSAPAPIEVLPSVVDKVAGRVPVFVDGAFARGSDVAKALALGATAAMAGRSLLWGLASNGEAGAKQALGFLREELDRVVGQLGCTNVDQLTREFIFKTPVY